MLARSVPRELPCWILPDTTYLSSEGFGDERFGLQRRSTGSQENEKPRQWRNRSVRRRSVKPSTRHCCSGLPVRLRNGATATAMLGSRQGHCGSDFRDSSDRWVPCFDDNGWCRIFYASIMSRLLLISLKWSKFN